MSVNKLTTKRFVIRKSLIGKNTIITFVNKKQETVSYNHDEVYNTHEDKFEQMNCFEKYKSYTNSNSSLVIIPLIKAKYSVLISLPVILFIIVIILYILVVV